MILALISVVAIIGIVHFIRGLWKSYNHWEVEGIKYEKNHIPFGILKCVVTREKSLGSAFWDTYQKWKNEPFVGVHLLHRPSLLVIDAKLCRQMLTTDFASFHDRGLYVDEKNDPFSANLFSLEGQEWRSLRAKLTPSFTSGKLKAMFPTIMETSNNLKNYLMKVTPSSGESKLEIKAITTKFACDIIGSVIFGIEANSFEDPQNICHRTARAATSLSIYDDIIGNLGFFNPSIAKLLNFLHFPEPKVNSLIKEMVKDTVQYREMNNVIRKDIMQMLIQLRNSGKINADDENWKFQTVAENLKSMSMEKLAAQGFLFFVAGFETTSATASYCLYELTQYPDLMERILAEIDEVLARYNGEITYEAIREMKFLDKCVMETNRKYPGLPVLNRQCTADYKVEGTNYTIKKGTPIVISLLGLHRDEEYFPEPMRFNPDRFDADNPSYDATAYMPFGEGPRNCIAFRLGKVNAKVAIITVLKNFRLECIEKKELEIDNYAVVIQPKGGVNVKISRRSF